MSGNQETPSDCATAGYDCGFNALWSNYGCVYIGCGSSGTANPYGAWAIPDCIMTQASAPTGECSTGEAANISFISNTYTGPWHYWAYNQGGPLAYSDIYPSGVATTPLTFAQWQSVWNQDVGSTFNATPTSGTDARGTSSGA
jgi:hypothetical protein